MNRLICRSLVAAALLSCGAAAAQTPQTREALEVIQLQPNFYMIAGAGGNIAVQIGPEGVVVVDSGTAAHAPAVVAAIRKLTDQQIRYIINTSADPDHVGGNEIIAKAGRALGAISPASAANGGAAAIIASETVLDWMSTPDAAGKTPYPVAAWPTESYSRKQKTLYLNNEGIQVLQAPAAHSDGDSIVFFRRSDVVVTGDIFDTTRFPVIEVDKGGSIQGELDAVNRLIDIVIPSIPLPFKDGGTRVIPGHGRICEQAEIVEYRDMLTIIRDTIQHLIGKGLTLAQVKAANPTQGFRGRYGADSGPWTTDMFVEAVYKNLTVKK